MTNSIENSEVSKNVYTLNNVPNVKYTKNTEGKKCEESESLLRVNAARGSTNKCFQLFRSSSSTEKEKKDDDVPNVPFFTLFRFASITDKIYIFIALTSSLLCGLTSPASVLLFSALLQAMVDYGISVKDGTPNNEGFMQAVLNFVIYNCLLGLITIILSYLATALMNISAFKQVYRIRQEYFKAALNQDFAYFDTNQTGDVAAKMSADVVKLEDGIGEKLATFVYYQSAFVSSIVMALIRGWKLALICLVSFPVTLIFVGLAELIASSLTKKESKASGKAGAVAEEVLSAIRTVYAFSGQQKEIQRYETHLNEARKINIKRGFYNGVSMGLQYFLGFCSYALSIWFGYKLTISEPETYNVDTLLAVFFGVMTGSEYFGISSTLMEVFGISRGAAAQIFNLIDNVPTINPLLNAGTVPKFIEGNIDLENVVFHYPSRPDIPVLNGVSISVQRGQSVALVGHSGSGKSTIIQLLSRYYDVLEGSVRVDGHDVRELSVRWLRAQIGLVGQEPVLFNTTVRQNIRYGREDATDAEIEAAAKQANAHHFIVKLPLGYETVVGERGTSMSGGQKQRIAIARALVRNPPILLLDEATSALDTNSEAKVQQAIDKAQEGRTTIVVAHRLSTIRNVDKIYVFKSGTVIESGNHKELMTAKGHYYDMVMMQSSPDTNESDQSKALNRTMSIISEQDEDEIPNIKLDEKEEDLSADDISFWRVIRLNSPEWKSITLASASSLLSGIAFPLFSVILGDFVGVLSNPNVEEALEYVKGYALIYVAIGTFSAITNFIVVFGYAIAGECLTERLRKLMFEKLLHQEIAFFDDKKNSTGALCARLSGEAALVQGATGQRIGTVIQAIGTFLFGLVLSLYYEWRIGLVALTFVPLMVGILYKEGRIISAESFGTAKTMEESSQIAVEAVANIRTVASLGREATFCKEYASRLHPALKLANKSAHVRGVVYGLARGLFNFVYAGAMYYGSTLMVSDRIHYSIVIKSSEALLMSSMSAVQGLAFAPNFQKGIKAAARIVLMLSRKSQIEDPVQPTVENFRGTGEASLEKVNFKYPTRPLIRVLKDLDLKIEQGKTIALVGSSGCGKSTVIQLLERYYDPDEGTVAQNDIPLPKLLLADVRQTIGFVQQEPILFDRTIGENIAYGDNSRVPTMDEIVDVAKQANIHKFILTLPMGYETNIGSKGTQLSGGQKQRVAIARALIRQPQMLLLDEATSALDTESERIVQAALETAKAGRTCVVIAHRLSTVRDADRICVISDGQVAESGTHHELMALKGLYYSLVRRG
ncbi:ATP-dependent translocase ABCB1-like [Epargyreus clarus]|uniref:ATP-dependent translocase ABCB1-like n=1 Tax=Epargyreus clarus TaxID=520877 RepID=UPI003C2F96F4